MSMKKQRAHRYGLAAETLAEIYLRLKCYRIMARRLRNPQGEIDLLARRGNTLVAVEVKARRTLFECEDSVPPWKRRKIARAMEGVLAGQNGKITGLGRTDDFNIRFDVIWIAPWQWPRHIEDAWRV